MGIFSLIFLVWFVLGGWAVVGNLLAAAFPFMVIYVAYKWYAFDRDESQRNIDRDEDQY